MSTTISIVSENAFPKDLRASKLKSIVVDLSELFNLNSINYSKEYLPQLEKFISIYNFFEDGKSLTIKSLINKTEIEESDIFKIVIWLIKFGYIAFNGEVDEK